MRTNQYTDIVQDGQSAIQTNKVLRQAYVMVGLSLIPTILGAMLELQTLFLTQMIMKSPLIYLGVTLVLFYGLTAAIEKNKTRPLGLVLMFAFTFLMGIALGPLLLMVLSKSNGMNLILTAAGGTAALFLGLAAIGSNTEKNFSAFARVIGLSVPILMVTVVLNFLFFKMPMISIAISCAIIPLSGMIIVYRINDAARGGENNYISLALDIYIGLYNIFSAILRLLMIFAGED